MPRLCRAFLSRSGLRPAVKSCGPSNKFVWMKQDHEPKRFWSSVLQFPRAAISPAFTC